MFSLRLFFYLLIMLRCLNGLLFISNHSFEDSLPQSWTNTVFAGCQFADSRNDFFLMNDPDSGFFPDGEQCAGIYLRDLEQTGLLSAAAETVVVNSGSADLNTFYYLSWYVERERSAWITANTRVRWAGAVVEVTFSNAAGLLYRIRYFHQARDDYEYFPEDQAGIKYVFMEPLANEASWYYVKQRPLSADRLRFWPGIDLRMHKITVGVQVLKTGGSTGNDPEEVRFKAAFDALALESKADPLTVITMVSNPLPDSYKNLAVIGSFYIFNRLENILLKELRLINRGDAFYNGDFRALNLHVDTPPLGIYNGEEVAASFDPDTEVSAYICREAGAVKKSDQAVHYLITASLSCYVSPEVLFAFYFPEQSIVWQDSASFDYYAAPDDMLAAHTIFKISNAVLPSEKNKVSGTLLSGVINPGDNKLIFTGLEDETEIRIYTVNGLPAAMFVSGAGNYFWEIPERLTGGLYLVLFKKKGLAQQRQHFFLRR